jgi:prepilin-type N-terminal cleavage/methylation domain-containing protein
MNPLHSLMNTLRTNRNAFAHGFTLIELIAVIVVLVILASVAVLRYIDYCRRACIAVAANTLKTVARALTSYGMEFGRQSAAVGTVGLTEVDLRAIPTLVARLPNNTLGPRFLLEGSSIYWHRAYDGGSFSIYDPRSLRGSDMQTLNAVLTQGSGAYLVDWDTRAADEEMARVSYMWSYGE